MAYLAGMVALSKAKVKFYSSLAQKKFRQEHGMYLAAGWKLLDPTAPTPPIAVIVESRKAEKLNEITLAEQTEIYEASAADMKKISGMENPEGVVAVYKIPQVAPISPEIKEPVIILEHMNDPGNLGTIIRTAAWFGVRHLLIGSGSVDVHNPKCVRASMGGIFHIQAFYHKNIPEWIRQNSLPIYAAHMHGAPMQALRIEPHARLIFGTETQGLSLLVLDDPSVQKVQIPGSGKVESLNVASAAAILLSQLPG